MNWNQAHKRQKNTKTCSEQTKQTKKHKKTKKNQNKCEKRACLCCSEHVVLTIKSSTVFGFVEWELISSFWCCGCFWLAFTVDFFLDCGAYNFLFLLLNLSYYIFFFFYFESVSQTTNLFYIINFPEKIGRLRIFGTILRSSSEQYNDTQLGLTKIKPLTWNGCKHVECIPWPTKSTWMFFFA